MGQPGAGSAPALAASPMDCSPSPDGARRPGGACTEAAVTPVGGDSDEIFDFEENDDDEEGEEEG